MTGKMKELTQAHDDRSAEEHVTIEEIDTTIPAYFKFYLGQTRNEEVPNECVYGLRKFMYTETDALIYGTGKMKELTQVT